MATVSVVYHSGMGHTARLAEAVVRGVKSVEGVQPRLIPIMPGELDDQGRWVEESFLEKLDASDAIIFGCPTYMGSVSSVFKAFMEACGGRFFSQAWKDKLAGGFTNSATMSGDKLATLTQLFIHASQLGMIWIPTGEQVNVNSDGEEEHNVNRIGSYIGVMAQSSDADPDKSYPPVGDLASGERYGRRIASIALKWTGEGDYETERYGIPNPLG